MSDFKLKEVYDPHKRECWSCKTINDHEAAVTPWVLCPHCGSQDTRRIVQPPQPYRPQPGDDVWVRAKVREVLDDYRKAVRIEVTVVDPSLSEHERGNVVDQLYIPLTAIRPLHAKEM